MKTKRVIILGVIFLFIVSLALSPGCTKETEIETEIPPPTLPETDVVTFPDWDLHTAVWDALGKPSGEEITAAELVTLTTLEHSLTSCRPEGRIANLSGLEYCTNLTELNLGGNDITDISHLSSLTNLNQLYLLYENQISDISPLVENSGLGVEDMVALDRNNLDL